MIFHQIVACSQNGVIGREGDLPWRIKADLKFFKETTLGHAVIMGRKTFESIGRPLPGRLCVVISRSGFSFDHPSVVCVASIEKALELCRESASEWPSPAYIVGGGEVYRQTNHVTDRIILTRVHCEIEGDTYFEDPSLQGFYLSETSPSYHEEGFSFAMETWSRRPQTS